jgi:hypothetical protein
MLGWATIVGDTNRDTHKTKVNQIYLDMRKIAGLPVMRNLIEPLDKRQGITWQRLAPNVTQHFLVSECRPTARTER